MIKSSKGKELGVFETGNLKEEKLDESYNDFYIVSENFEISYDKNLSSFFINLNYNEYVCFKNNYINSEYYKVYLDESNTHYYLKKPSIFKKNSVIDKYTIVFDLYFESNNKLSKDMNIIYKEVKFTITDELHKKIGEIDGAIINYQGLTINFKLKTNTLYILITSDNSNNICQSNIISAFFNYIFFTSGCFIRSDQETIYKTSELTIIKEVSEKKYNSYNCQNFTLFSVPISKKMFEKSFFDFLSTYKKYVYPIENFIQTQTKIKYNVQQRASLILNSLEGTLKRALDKKTIKISMIKSNKKAIMSAVKENTIQFLNSDEFIFLLNSFEQEVKLDKKTNHRKNFKFYRKIH